MRDDWSEYRVGGRLPPGRQHRGTGSWPPLPGPMNHTRGGGPLLEPPARLATRFARSLTRSQRVCECGSGFSVQISGATPRSRKIRFRPATICASVLVDRSGILETRPAWASARPRACVSTALGLLKRAASASVNTTAGWMLTPYPRGAHRPPHPCPSDRLWPRDATPFINRHDLRPLEWLVNACHAWRTSSGTHPCINALMPPGTTKAEEVAIATSFPSAASTSAEAIRSRRPM